MDKSSEFDAFLELAGMLVTDPRTAVLLALLLVAAITDYRTFKIPNWLTGGGLLFALVYTAFVPPVYNATWLWAPAGALLGFVVTLPMYVLRTMGAGDVKLMTMVGAFLGVTGTLYALIFSFVTAGVAAIAFAASQGVATRMFGNVRRILHGMAWSAIGGVRPTARIEQHESVGKLAYGISIALGTTIYVVAQHFNFIE
ncbi:MAG TPA: A24 family peptidase [Telluria sp.]|nr:A24 family peptidase [Telluria sp.]